MGLVLTVEHDITAAGDTKSTGWRPHCVFAQGTSEAGMAAGSVRQRNTV